jgi:hypothetical protein
MKGKDMNLTLTFSDTWDVLQETVSILSRKDIKEVTEAKRGPERVVTVEDSHGVSRVA